MTGSAATVLPDGTRLVHIGPYKTGTTAIQAAFHLARKMAEPQGVHYAGYGRQPMTAVMAGIGKPSPWSKDRKPPNQVVWRQLVSEIRSSNARQVVLRSGRVLDYENLVLATGSRPRPIPGAHTIRTSGLVEAMKVVGSIEGIEFIRFDEKDVVRHQLVQQIVKAYESYGGSRQ